MVFSCTKNDNGGYGRIQGRVCVKYLALLRGINVSGHRKIKMAELKFLFESSGFGHVSTYIQSGNVIFESTVVDKTKIRDTIEHAIVEEYSFQVAVLLRNEEELFRIISENPFNPVDLEKEGTKFLVTFLESSPFSEHVGLLDKFKSPGESFEVLGSHMYLHCPAGYGQTKLSNNLIGKKLNLQSTTRNWKTVIKLSQMFN